MVKVCVYCNRKYPDGNLTFHKFPSDKERQKKWLSAMKIPREDIDKNSYLCSEHFADNTFSSHVVNNLVHRFLYIDAVPSIFKDFSIKVNDVTDFSSRNLETPQESKNVGTMQISQQNRTTDEELYYYKIINGVIRRFPKNDIMDYDFTSVDRDTIFEIPRDKKENVIDTVSNTLKSENILEQNTFGTVHIEESEKVKVLPVHPLPIEIWNGDMDSKESICDFKSEQNQNHEPKLVYEDIMMDTDDMNLLINNEYSNLNGLNDIEINAYNPLNLEVNHQEETSVSKDEMDKEEPAILCENIVEKETSDEPKPKRACVRKRSSSTNDPNESTEVKSMKSLLYKCLENKNSSDLDLKLRKYTKCKLTQLLKTALNYIECLEDKLTITTEQNMQYEKHILELENLIQSIGDD